MKAFLWDGLPRVSDNYHPEGSAMIEAETIERAREIANENFIEGTKRDPDLIFDSPAIKEKVWIFPNAGCC